MPAKKNNPAPPRAWTTFAPDIPWVIGHRGHAEKYPENTLVSFRAAIEAGADLVELDYRSTADGVLVCSHDDETGRRIDLLHSPGAEGRRISTTRAADVAGWRCLAHPASPHPPAFVPTLEEALAEILDRGAVPVLERKGGSPEQTQDLLRRLRVVDRVCVQAFDWDFLRALRDAEPEIPLAALGKDGFSFRRIPDLEKIGATIVNWDYYGLTGTDVDRLHAAGWPVWTWTVNRELDFRHALHIGLDAVTTDAPDRLRRFLDRKPGGDEPSHH